MSRQVLTYPDLPSVQTQDQADLRYLSLSGGTVTGNLGVGIAPVTIGDGGNPRLLHVGNTGAGGYGLLQLTTNQTGMGVTGGAITFGSTGYSNTKRFGQIGANSAAAGTADPSSYMTFWTANGAGLVERLRITSLGTLQVTADTGQIAATFNENVRWLSGKPALWQDPTNNYYLGWRMSNASPAQLTLCYWGGDTLIHFGTEGLHTPYLIAVPGNHMYLRGLNSGHNLYVDQWGSVLFTHMGGGLVGPASDNAYMLGQGGFRWTTVFAVTGAINTCSREVKEIVGTVDDTVALQQLMGLPAIYRFHYKHRVPVADADSEAPEEERFTLETDTSKEFIGPVAEEMPMDMKVGEFEGGNVNTEGHLMASLRGAVKEYRDRITDLANRMTILEGRLPA